jgi:CBS-domain-containing membrane protein
MKTKQRASAPDLTLDAKTAVDLMTPHVVSIRDSATLREAVNLLLDKNVSALPVLDGIGRPIGVLSRSDVVAHDRKYYEQLQPGQEVFKNSNFVARSSNAESGTSRDQSQAVLVKDVMTPVVFSVARQTPASTVVGALLCLMVHRLFVTDHDGGLLGVISSTDILRHLHQ